MGEVIQFIPRPNPNRKTLEQQAQELAKEFNRMAEEGTEVVCVMDTAPSEIIHTDTGDCA
jgi:hypothetical protein